MAASIHNLSLTGTQPKIIEEYFTPAEVAGVLKVHTSTIIRMFQDDPGVLKISTPRRGKRPKVLLRIPKSHLAQVIAERSR